MIRNENFLSLTVEKKLLTQEDTRKLSAKYEGDAFAVLMHLVRGAVAKKDYLGQLWGDSLNVSYINLSKSIIQSQALQLLPEDFARSNKVMPVYQFGEALTVASANPTDKNLTKEIEKTIMKPVSMMFAFTEDIEDAIAIHYQSSTGLGALIQQIASSSLFKATSKISPEQLKKLSGDQSIIQLTQGTMLLAVKERASDIHIEPEEDAVRIRFRIDGVLHERMKIDSALLAPIITRYKVLANMDITEKRRPQDGRITLKLTNSSIDMRFSSVPTIYGEKIVLRILGQAEMREAPDIYDIGLAKSNLTVLERIIGNPNGVFFVTGPTGSGKTTTLYAAIKHINKPGINIMTIEDPVEIRLPGVNQVQINPDIDFGFAPALRAFLRQDPDVILVGEIRDVETAKMASQAALTGHLVLATMHTNNALQAVTRLVEIGIEPFLVAPSIIGTMAQRLVRRLCDNCKEKYRLDQKIMDNLFIHDGSQEVYFYRAKGCDDCHNLGYSGRIAIHEVFLITEEVRHLISHDSSILDIQETASKSGFKNMRYDGIKKVLRGLTTIDEIDRATLAE
jgi:type IV pilus assembly protein PilB